MGLLFALEGAQAGRDPQHRRFHAVRLPTTSVMPNQNDTALSEESKTYV